MTNWTLRRVLTQITVPQQRGQFPTGENWFIELGIPVTPVTSTYTFPLSGYPGSRRMA